MNPIVLPIPVILTRCYPIADTTEVLAGFGIKEAIATVLNSESRPAGEGDGVGAIVARGDLVTNEEENLAIEAFGQSLVGLSGTAQPRVLIVHPGGLYTVETLAGSFENMTEMFQEPVRSVWKQLIEGPVVEYTSQGGGDKQKLGDFIHKWAVSLGREDLDDAGACLERLRQILASQVSSGSKNWTKQVALALEGETPKTATVKTFASAMHGALASLSQLILEFQLLEEGLSEGGPAAGGELKHGLVLWQKTRALLQGEVRDTVSRGKWDQFDQTLREKFESNDLVKRFERLLLSAAGGNLEETRKALPQINAAALRRWASELVAALEQYRS